MSNYLTGCHLNGSVAVLEVPLGGNPHHIGPDRLDARAIPGWGFKGFDGVRRAVMKKAFSVGRN